MWHVNVVYLNYLHGVMNKQLYYLLIRIYNLRIQSTGLFNMNIKDVSEELHSNIVCFYQAAYSIWMTIKLCYIWNTWVWLYYLLPPNGSTFLFIFPYCAVWRGFSCLKMKCICLEKISWACNWLVYEMVVYMRWRTGSEPSYRATCLVDVELMLDAIS